MTRAATSSVNLQRRLANRSSATGNKESENGNENMFRNLGSRYACDTRSSNGVGGHARPEPHCVINDYDPPTNVRTQPNGTIIGRLNNGDEIRVVDQMPAMIPGRWPVGGLWDFVQVRGEGNGWEPYGWVYDPLIRCE